MITCICNNVTDSKILCAIDDGYNSLELLQSTMALGDKCKRCTASVQQLIDNHKQTEVPQ